MEAHTELRSKAEAAEAHGYQMEAERNELNTKIASLTENEKVFEAQISNLKSEQEVIRAEALKASET